MNIEYLTIAERFRGPPRSGNGGYTCGLVAQHLRGHVAVRLKAPPPLDADLRLESSPELAQLFHDATLIAEAKVSALELEAPPVPSYDEAAKASGSFLGFRTHPFPGCFVCGIERGPVDGMRIFPGRLPDSSVLAAPWTPDATLGDESGHVRPQFLWSALDCPGAFAVMPIPPGLTIVLGELCASIVSDLRTQEPCVVVAWPLGIEGRKRLAGSAIFGPGARLIALGRAVWIEVPSSSWG
jgi:hypothetical protein